MFKDDAIRLRHILDAANDALSFIENKNRSSLDNDRQLVLALVKTVEIIGEAASQLSDETKEKLPLIPWQKIIGMRNRLVHAYFDINLDILWKTVADGLWPLLDEISRILK